MAQARHLLKLAAQALQQIPLLDLFCLPHNLNKEVMEATQVISNKDMASMVAKLAVNMQVSAEREVTKLLDKATRTVNTEPTKHLEVIIMAIASNVADGVATMDTN